jgi:integrase
MSRKGQYRYYVKAWDEATGSYSVPRSASAIARELGLDPKAFPASSRTGALLIGEELRRRGGSRTPGCCPLFADYCAEIWDWESSTYIRSKREAGQRIGREYVAHNAAYVRLYIRPAFPKARLDAVRLHMLEGFAQRLKEGSGLGNSSINAILNAAQVPLREAARIGILAIDPTAGIRKLAQDSAEKGIPTSAEVVALLALEDVDPRIRAAMLLACACALRLGEIQALRPGDIEGNTLRVRHSWGKLEGLKETKTARERIVPLPRLVRESLLKLEGMNPHGGGEYLIYGSLPYSPLDIRALERGFYRALGEIGIPEGERRARGLSFHSLRHWSNAMLRGTISDEKLRLITGHSTAAMTDRYDHITDSDLCEVARAQESRLLPLMTS